MSKRLRERVAMMVAVALVMGQASALQASQYQMQKVTKTAGEQTTPPAITIDTTYNRAEVSQYTTPEALVLMGEFFELEDQEGIKNGTKVLNRSDENREYTLEAYYKEVKDEIEYPESVSDGGVKQKYGLEIRDGNLVTIEWRGGGDDKRLNFAGELPFNQKGFETVEMIVLEQVDVESLDVSKCKGLQILELMQTGLHTLNIKGCNQLEYLAIAYELNLETLEFVDENQGETSQRKDIVLYNTRIKDIKLPWKIDTIDGKRVMFDHPIQEVNVVLGEQVITIPSKNRFIGIGDLSDLIQVNTGLGIAYGIEKTTANIGYDIDGVFNEGEVLDQEDERTIRYYEIKEQDRHIKIKNKYDTFSELEVAMNDLKQTSTDKEISEVIDAIRKCPSEEVRRINKEAIRNFEKVLKNRGGIVSINTKANNLHLEVEELGAITSMIYKMSGEREYDTVIGYPLVEAVIDYLVNIEIDIRSTSKLQDKLNKAHKINEVMFEKAWGAIEGSITDYGNNEDVARIGVAVPSQINQSLLLPLQATVSLGDNRIPQKVYKVTGKEANEENLTFSDKVLTNYKIDENNCVTVPIGTAVDNYEKAIYTLEHDTTTTLVELGFKTMREQGDGVRPVRVGDQLKDVKIVGKVINQLGEEVEGTFVWENDAQVVVEDMSYVVQFIPKEIALTGELEGTVVQYDTIRKHKVLVEKELSSSQDKKKPLEKNNQEAVAWEYGTTSSGKTTIQITVNPQDKEESAREQGVVIEIPMKENEYKEEKLSIIKIEEDGSEQVLKKAIVKDGKIILEVKEDMTIEVRDVHTSFVDVKENAWYNQAIDFVVGREIFCGVNENEFAPNQEMSRAMFATVMHRLEGKPSIEGNQTTMSKEESRWYSEAMNWALETGIMNDELGKSSDALEGITRGELIDGLYNYSNKKELISKHQTPLEWVMETGIFIGDAKGELSVEKNVTRVEVAQIIERLIEWELITRVQEDKIKN